MTADTVIIPSQTAPEYTARSTQGYESESRENTSCNKPNPLPKGEMNMRFTRETGTFACIKVRAASPQPRPTSRIFTLPLL